MTPDRKDRPGTVGVVSILVLVSGLALIVMGASAVIFRDSSLVDLPVAIGMFDAIIGVDANNDLLPVGRRARSFLVGTSGA